MKDYKKKDALNGHPSANDYITVSKSSGYGNPEILLHSLVEDSRSIAGHKTGLVFECLILLAVPGGAGHLIIAVEVALLIELAEVSLCGNRAHEVRLDSFDVYSTTVYIS